MKTASVLALKKIFSRNLIIIAAVVLVVIALIPGVYFFNQYQKTQSLLKNPDQVKTEDNAALIKKVGKLIKLPDETPAVATVSDVTKLANQSLFKNAQNGDKVLIYSQTRKAILYRPSTGQIIDIGSIVPSQESASSGATPVPSAQKQKVKVVLYNGTKTVGYAKKIGADLAAKYPDVQVSGTENAIGEYKKTVVVDISGKNKAVASALATELKGEVGSIPSVEVKPDNADILIILGQ